MLIQFAVSIRDRKQNRDLTGDPWDGRTLEWATASPPPFYNFAIVPKIDLAGPVLGRQGDRHAPGSARPTTRTSTCRATPAPACTSRPFSLVLCFALVWHIWPLAVVGLVGMIGAFIAAHLRPRRGLLRARPPRWSASKRERFAQQLPCMQAADSMTYARHGSSRAQHDAPWPPRRRIQDPAGVLDLPDERLPDLRGAVRHLRRAGRRARPAARTARSCSTCTIVFGETLLLLVSAASPSAWRC